MPQGMLLDMGCVGEKVAKSAASQIVFEEFSVGQCRRNCTFYEIKTTLVQLSAVEPEETWCDLNPIILELLV
jgi:hypothetical protein